MRPWLKAGLIGGGVLAVWAAISALAPLVRGAVISFCACILVLMTHLGIGVLAAWWLKPPRTAKEGAKEGALAGLAAGVIHLVASILIALIISPIVAQHMVSETFQEIFQPLQMPREVRIALEIISETAAEVAGVTSSISHGVTGMKAVCGICTLPLVVALSAVSGAILAAVKRD
ncbi:MAG: hypothetical protein ACK4WK_11875 [Anaerolineae bacterium]